MPCVISGTDEEEFLINGDNGNKVFKTLEEALSYQNKKKKKKYPNSYELYIKE